MAAAAGILLLIKKATVAIAGLQSTSVKFGLETIDITSMSDAGFVKLLGATTRQNFTVTGSGVENGGVLATLWAAPATSKILTDITFTLPGEASGGDVFAGDVVLTNYEITGEYNGAVMFNATFVSAGTWAAS